MTDKHERQIYQLNEKLVSCYREIKNMATEIATLRYELNCKYFTSVFDFCNFRRSSFSTIILVFVFESPMVM